MNVHYNDKTIKPLGMADIKYQEGYFGPTEGSREYEDLGGGFSVFPVWKHDELGYGYIMVFDGNHGPDANTQIFVPYVSGTASFVNNSIKIRSNGDMGNSSYGWTPWRELVYKDEIEDMVNKILSEKGLI